MSKSVAPQSPGSFGDFKGVPEAQDGITRRAEGRAGYGGFKDSLGIEALAIFALATYIIRVLADVIQRAGGGRSFGQGGVNDLSYYALSLLEGGVRLYSETLQVDSSGG